METPITEYKDDVPAGVAKVEGSLVSGSPSTPVVDSPAKTEDTSKDTDNLPSFEDFALIGTGADIPVKKPAIEDKPKVEDETSAKVNDEKTKLGAADKVGRDYTGFTEEEQQHLKRMSNESYAWVLPKLKERANLAGIIKVKDTELASLKTGKQLLPDSYFEHPEAYVLDPAYGREAVNLDLTSAYVQHWRQQKINVSKGQPWQTIDVNQKTGQLVYGKPQEVSEDNKAEVLEHIDELRSWAQSENARVRGNIVNMQQAFKGRHQSNLARIKEAEQKFFKAYEDDKHPYAPVRKNVLESIPAELRNSPLASIFASSVTANMQVSAANKAMNDELAKWRSGEMTVEKYKAGTKGAASVNGNLNDKKETLSDDKKKAAGPTNSDIPGTGLTNKGKKEHTEGTNIEDFEKYLATH